MVERLQVGHASTPAGPWVKVPTRVVSTPGGSVTESEEDSFIWKGQWTTPPPPFAAGVDDAVVDMVLYGGVLDEMLALLLSLSLSLMMLSLLML